MAENQFDDGGIHSKINEWLDSQGYPLEMKVERILRKSGFKTYPSDYYVDPESSDSREIDVYAFKEIEVGGAVVRTSLCIECKSSKSKPWIMFACDKSGLRAPARVVQRAASQLGKKLLFKIKFDKPAQELRLMQVKPIPAYGLSQAFTSGLDAAYSACISVAKCASAKAVVASEAKTPIFEFIFPVVVIEGRLFRTYLDRDSNSILEEVPSSTLVWRNRIYTSSAHTIIKISTLDGLTDLIKEVNEAVDYLNTQHGKILELVDEWQKPVKPKSP